MTNLHGIMRLARLAAAGTKVAANGLKAKEGDLDALQYLIRDGAFELLDAHTKGSGQLARQAVTYGWETIQTVRGKRDGPAQIGAPTEDPELDHFQDWLAARDWGNFIILGPKGKGKTSKALRLAEVWHDALGYEVWGVNIWPEDGLPGVLTVDMEELELVTEIVKARVKGLSQLFAAADEEDDDDAPRPKKKRLPNVPLESLRRKIIVIDESTLAMGNHGADRGRRVVRRLMAIARHMMWLVIFTTIFARLVPLDLLGAEGIFCVEPSGKEKWTDRPEAPEVVEMWEAAEKGFAELARHPYRDEFPRNIAWAFGLCEDAGGRPFRGMVPFRKPGARVLAEEVIDAAG